MIFWSPNRENYVLSGAWHTHFEGFFHGVTFSDLAQLRPDYIRKDLFLSDANNKSKYEESMIFFVFFG
jgi:hypothetical protein